MTGLLPCPFCNAPGMIAKTSKGQFYPVCTGNYDTSPEFLGWCLLTRQPDPEADGYITEEAAAAQWNRRLRAVQP